MSLALAPSAFDAVQRLSFAHVNHATVRVLAAEGCGVHSPSGQGCCGALSLHAGRIEQARVLARHNIEVFEAAGVERIAVNAAGCGSAMKEHGELFAHDPAWAGRPALPLWRFFLLASSPGRPRDLRGSLHRVTNAKALKAKALCPANRATGGPVL